MATLNHPVENTAFNVSLIRRALINRAPSAEAAGAKEHLPTIQLSDPRPAGSQPTLCCKESLLTPSIKATLIFCLKQPTALAAAPPPPLNYLRPRQKKVTTESWATISALPLCHLPYIYTPSGTTDSPGLSSHGSYIPHTRGGQRNNCASNLASCLSQVGNQILRTMQGEHNGGWWWSGSYCFSS